MHFKFNLEMNCKCNWRAHLLIFVYIVMDVIYDVYAIDEWEGIM